LLLFLNVPLVGLWTRILAVPYRVLVPIIFVFIIIGCFAVDGSTYGIFVTVIFGVVGWIFRRLEIPLTPLILTFILGPMMEIALRQSLQLSQGELSIFVTRPIALVFLAIAVLVLLVSAFGSIRKIVFNERKSR
jgi:putative tricarboxylic transport membrane protein